MQDRKMQDLSWGKVGKLIFSALPQNYPFCNMLYQMWKYS